MSKQNERRREIQAMSGEQSQQELADLRRKLFELRLQKARGEVRDNRQFPQMKADIARLMYHLSELRHAQEMAASGELAAETAGEE